MPIIQCEGVTKTYESEGVLTNAVREVSFGIDRGEFVSIMGPSGSGKSTLMHILGLLDRATSGRYLFDGKDVMGFDEDVLARLRNRRIGFVFQSFNLLARTSVYENVELPLLYNLYEAQGAKKTQGTRDEEQAGGNEKQGAGDKGQEGGEEGKDGEKKTGRGKGICRSFLGMMRSDCNRDRVLSALRSVGMEGRVEYKSNQLSGGEKQRVAIARALVNDPDIIFADEPTGNLDSKSGLQVMRILQDLNAEGKTIILVTHETYTAEHAGRIIRMRDGAIESDEAVLHRRDAGNEKILK